MLNNGSFSNSKVMDKYIIPYLFQNTDAFTEEVLMRQKQHLRGYMERSPLFCILHLSIFPCRLLIGCCFVLLTIPKKDKYNDRATNCSKLLQRNKSNSFRDDREDAEDDAPLNPKTYLKKPLNKERRAHCLP